MAKALSTSPRAWNSSSWSSPWIMGVCVGVCVGVGAGMDERAGDCGILRRGRRRALACPEG